MTPLRQVWSHHHTQIGDCFRTCVASLLSAQHPGAVPHVMAQVRNDHRQGRPMVPNVAQEVIAGFRRWLRPMSLDLAEIGDPGILPPGSYCIGIHRVADGSNASSHAVVCDHEGTVVMNPVAPGHEPYVRNDWLEWLCITEPYHPAPDDLLAHLAEHGPIATELVLLPDDEIARRFSNR